MFRVFRGHSTHCYGQALRGERATYRVPPYPAPLRADSGLAALRSAPVCPAFAVAPLLARPGSSPTHTTTGLN